MKTTRIFFRIGVLFFISTILLTGASAQGVSWEGSLRDRAEALLQAAREEKWNLISYYVIVSVDKKAPETRRRFNILEDDTPQDVENKIAAYFKALYGSTKPGRVISATIFPEDESLAGIAYEHGDKDGFTMRFYKGRWYFTFDREFDPIRSKEAFDLRNVWQRAEIFLQKCREGKWDDLYQFAAMSKNIQGRRTTRLIGKLEGEEKQKLKADIAKRYQSLYGNLKPGRIEVVGLSEKDRTVAYVNYRHEDLDGFEMVLVDGEWYKAVAEW